MNIDRVNDVPAPIIFDTHAHLNFEPFLSNFSDTIARFTAQGVAKVMIPAVKRADFHQLLHLVLEDPSRLVIALGLHPLFIDHHQVDDLEFLVETIHSELSKKNSSVKAIGEIGLDAFAPGTLSSESFKKQLYFFEQQLHIAQKYELPAIIHSRKTHAVILKALKNQSPNLRGVIHGFTGSYQEAIQFIKLGFMIGVGGVITYPRANKTRDAISKIPLDSIVLETDSPDMPLMGQQGSVNRCENIQQIFNTLCQLRVENHDEIASTIWKNSLLLFK